MTTREKRDEINGKEIRRRIEQLEAPAMRIKARLSTGARPDMFDTLGRTLHLCLGARVMITHNLCVPHGLVNGTRGIVEDIIVTRDQVATAVLVRVHRRTETQDGYSGPCFLRGALAADDPATEVRSRAEPGPVCDWSRRCQPCAVCRRWSSPFLSTSWSTTTAARRIHAGSSPCIWHGPSRYANEAHRCAHCDAWQKAFAAPLARQVHKAQGLTLSRTTYDAGNNEWAVGQTFVALTRVRHPGHFAFSPMPDGAERLTSEIASRPQLFTRKLHEHLLRSMFRATANRNLHLHPPPSAFDPPKPKPQKYMPPKSTEEQAASKGQQTLPHSAQPQPVKPPVQPASSTITPAVKLRAPRDILPTQQAKRIRTLEGLWCTTNAGSANAPGFGAGKGAQDGDSFLAETYLQQNERTLREWGLLDASASLRLHLGQAGTQPQWLSEAGLELHARIVDYWAPSTTWRATRVFLERLGFHVTTETAAESGVEQLGSSCGIVASEAAVTMKLAGEDWKLTDVSGAADREVVSRANLCQDKWAEQAEPCHHCNGCRSAGDSGQCREPRDLRFTPEQLMEDAYRTRFMQTTEVHRLARLAWALQLNDPSDATHIGDWLTVCALDSAVLQVARDVRAAATSGLDHSSRWRCIISNTQTSDCRGHHWFTLAYSIRRSGTDHVHPMVE